MLRLEFSSGGGTHRAWRLPRAVLLSAEILVLLGDWGSVTVPELRQLLDMHEGNIRKHLSIADAQGLPERDE